MNGVICEDVQIRGYVKRDDLYSLVDMKIKDLGIKTEDYPINTIELIDAYIPNLSVVIEEFEAKAVCGILYKGRRKSKICLNSLRDDKGKNFDCMHELIHFWFHPPATRWCIYDRVVNQHRGIEWQANEGAAQALMPRELFIEKYYEFKGNQDRLSDFFFVGKHAVQYRITNLKREIIAVAPKHLKEKTRQQLKAEPATKTLGKYNGHDDYSGKNSFSEFFLNFGNVKF